MDEMRNALMKLAYNIRQMTGGLMMEDERAITLEDVLELIRVDSFPSPVQVVGPDDAALTGSAKAALWAAFANQRVRTMRAEQSRIVIWLEEEPDGEE